MPKGSKVVNISEVTEGRGKKKDKNFYEKRKNKKKMTEKVDNKRETKSKIWISFMKDFERRKKVEIII